MDKNCSNGKRKKKREERRDNSWDSDLVKPKTKRWSAKRRVPKEEENVYWNSEVQRSRKQKFSKSKKDKVEEYVDSSKAKDVNTKESKPKKKKYCGARILGDLNFTEEYTEEIFKKQQR